MARGSNPLLSKLSGNLGDYSVAQVNGQPVLRARPTSSGAESEAQSRQRALVGSLAQTWKTLSPTQKNGWLLLGAQMTDAKGRALTGFQAFIMVNTTLGTIGSAYVMDAPASPTPPPALPPVLMLQARQTVTSPFSLILSSPAYAGRVLISGASSVLAGRDSLIASAFKPLGQQVGLGTGTNLTALYVARFGIPALGMKVALRLTPVTDAGFRGIPRMIMAVVASQAAEDSAGDSLLKAA